MAKSILAESSKSCTGCSACMAVCPKSAISIVLNREGFYSAIVDKERCVDCGICQTVCARFVSPEEGAVRMKDCSVAGAYSSSAKVQSSTTSGGLAYELSKWGIENGYKIFGVVYDYGNDKARGVLIERNEELELLKGSKYLQANVAHALSALVDDAKQFPNNKYICFGTPCQVFGVRHLIERKKLKNDFLLVDLFCHGVPSYNVWKPYIAEMHKKMGTLRNVNFRYKGNGWHQYTIKIDGETNTYQEYAYKDTFYRFFFDNVALNTSCFTCEARKNYVAADLRLGDFLGKAYEHREDGISAVMIATEKGRLWIERLLQEKRIILDKYWEADSCLVAQSTHDYLNMELRNEVINRLGSGVDLSDVLHWYFRKLPIKFRVRSILKRIVCRLPVSVVIMLRKIIRKM